MVVVIQIARIAGARRLCPGMIVGGVVEDEVRAQADVSLAQAGGECDQIVVGAQTGLHLAVVADRKAAIIVAGTCAQERQQMQVTHAQFLQIRHAFGHALQRAGKAVCVGAVAEHVLFAEPTGVPCAVEGLQRLRALPGEIAQFSQPLRQPRRIVGPLTVQRLQGIQQTRCVLVVARHHNGGALRIQRRGKGRAQYGGN